MVLSLRSLFLSFTFVFLLTFLTVAQENTPTLRPIQKGGKWGFIDKTGKVVIQPQFYWVEEFSEGLASFETEDGKHGYLDESGKIVVEPQFDRAEAFSEGLAPVAKKFEWGFIDKTGKLVIPLQYEYAHGFTDGLAPVVLFLEKAEAGENIFNKVAFIDKTGKTIVGPVKSILNPRASLGFVFLPHTRPVGETPDPEIMDKNGKILIQAESISNDGFQEGVTPVRKNGKWGYIDTTGKFVIEPQFAEAKSFSEGLALVQIGAKWGFIDRQGKLVVPAKFEINEFEPWNHSFSEGLALVYLNDELVFINQTGKKVLSVNYDHVEKFTGGVAQVKIDERKNEKRGYINKTGKFVWGPAEFKYKDIQAVIEKSAAQQEKEENEKLIALNDEEKNLNYRDLIANQPDFSADLSYFRSEMASGGGGAERLTRKGNRYRKESQFWIFIGERGKPRIRLFPQTKTYDDLEPAGDESLSYSRPFDPRTLANDANTIFTPLGKVMLDNRECLKVEVQRKGEKLEKEKISLYLAKDLKFLVIIAQAQNLPFSFGQRLSNISLEVADDLVQIPPDYKPIERDVWKKVENAKVKYQGKFAKDFGVFRSPADELFVWVKDAKYPWRYLIRPKQMTVETAFQGMLVTRNGDYIWRTKENEAFSNISYRNPLVIERTKSDAKQIIKQSNSIKFQSNDSKDIWIEIIF